MTGILIGTATCPYIAAWIECEQFIDLFCSVNVKLPHGIDLARILELGDTLTKHLTSDLRKTVRTHLVVYSRPVNEPISSQPSINKHIGTEQTNNLVLKKKNQ